MKNKGGRRNELEELKSEFIAVASHKMRNPLTAIKWHGESLLMGDAGKLTEKQKCFIKQILSNNRRLLNLLEDLLRVARVENGRATVKNDIVDLGCVAKEAISKMKNEITRKKIKLTYGGCTAKVRGDRDKIKQIFFDLLDNAVKYNFVGGKVKVRIKKSKDKYLCEISDSGVGIPKAEQKWIFSKFFRARNIVTMNTEGNGLSLYLIKAYIESHGGKIWLKSEPGKGSSFYFTFPTKLRN